MVIDFYGFSQEQNMGKAADSWIFIVNLNSVFFLTKIQAKL